MKRVMLALLAMMFLGSCATPKGKPEPYKATVKATKAKLDASKEAGASTCDTCVTIGSWIIIKVGCGAGEAALDVACTAAEIAFWEFDEIIAPLCTALEIGLPVVCEEMGSNWVKEYPDEAAKQICKTCGLCS
jgi:hypothetical protein